MRKVNVGVVGLGNMGGCGHIIWLSELENMNLAACCDRIPEKAKSFGEKYNIPYFTDAEEMMKSGLIEAIVIAVPHYDHTTIAIRAFELGLHVLTEKPVAVHKNDVLRMIKAHEAHPDKLFAAMFQMRLTPVYQKLRELIRRNEYDLIVCYMGTYDSTMHKKGCASPEAAEQARLAAERFEVLSSDMDQYYASYNRALVFVPDHGGHDLEDGHGTHGTDLEEDMLVSHYYRLMEKKAD